MLEKKRDSLYYESIATKSPETWSRYKSFRNKCASLFLGKKAQYFHYFIKNTALTTKKTLEKTCAIYKTKLESRLNIVRYSKLAFTQKHLFLC
jgi:hypothetical protein